MNDIEEALRYFNECTPGTYAVNHGRILAAEVARLREVEKGLRAEITGHDKKLRAAITEERFWEWKKGR